MWSRTAKMPTFTTTYANVLLCPTDRYSTPLFPTSYHFAPHSTPFSVLVKRNRGFFLRKLWISVRIEMGPLGTRNCGELRKNLQDLVVAFVARSERLSVNGANRLGMGFDGLPGPAASASIFSTVITFVLGSSIPAIFTLWPAHGSAKTCASSL